MAYQHATVLGVVLQLIVEHVEIRSLGSTGRQQWKIIGVLMGIPRMVKGVYDCVTNIRTQTYGLELLVTMNLCQFANQVI